MSNNPFDDDPPETTGDGLNTELSGAAVNNKETEDWDAPGTSVQPLNAAELAQESAEPLDPRDADERAHDELQGALDAAEAKLVDARTQSKEGLQREREALQEIQERRAALQKRFPPLTADQAIKQHLASEQARRVELAEQGRRRQIDVASGRIGADPRVGYNTGWNRPGRRGVVGADGNLIKLPDGSIVVPQQKARYRIATPVGQKA